LPVRLCFCHPFTIQDREKMDVSVVTVTFNSARQIGQCIASVRAQQGVNVEMIVVDNVSSDGTVDVVRGLGPDIQVVGNRENVGFGRANNQAFERARGRFVFLLNPDAQLTRPDGLLRLCQAMDAHPRWGVAGTRVLGFDGTMLLPQPHLDYPGEVRGGADFSNLPGKVAWVIGASMFFRREALVQTRGFDPDFFLYSEETDLCLRLRKQGHEVGFVEEVEVRHIGGASEVQRDPFDIWVTRMNSLYLFWRKHYPAAGVKRLVRHEWMRSIYRIGLCILPAVSQRPRGEAWERLRQWQATWVTSTRFLARGR
jgi:GT2 family glycosyltransferase